MAWKADQAMNWHNSRIFIDEARFNMHIRRKFGRSKRGIPAKAAFPSMEVSPWDANRLEKRNTAYFPQKSI